MTEPQDGAEDAMPPECSECTGEQTRRGFLFKLGVGMQALAGTLLALPLVGYAFSSFLEKDSRRWVGLGKAGDFDKGSTRLVNYVNPVRVPWSGTSGTDIPCWVRTKKDGGFQVFAINCAHLGCPVRFFDESQLFMCPCHGGVYYADGSRASGPPPRGLFEYQTKIENGELMIFAGRLPTLHESA